MTGKFPTRKAVRTRNSVAKNVKEVSTLWPRCENTNILEKSSHASTVKKPTSLWVRWKCTFGRTLFRVNAPSVEKLSAVRGYYKVTFVRTRERNRTNVQAAIELLLIDRIYVHTFRHTPWSKNTVVRNVLGLSLACPSYSNISIRAVMIWTYREFPLTFQSW